MDPLLKIIFGESQDTSFADDPRPLEDPIGNLFFKQKYGIPKPGAAPEPLTVEETAAALAKLREKLGDVAFAKKMRPRLNVLREGAEAYLGEDSFAARFLKGAVNGDQEAMRQAVRQLVRENQSSLVELHKRAGDSSVSKGEPDSVKKIGDWTYRYNSAGELAELFQGDVAPFAN